MNHFLTREIIACYAPVIEVPLEQTPDELYKLDLKGHEGMWENVIEFELRRYGTGTDN